MITARCTRCCVWFFFIFALLLLQAQAEEWHLFKNRELGTIPPAATLRSFSFKKGNEEQAEIKALIFHEKDFSFEILDRPLQDQSLLEALHTGLCAAGVNGGYFQPNGTPLGLLMHDGKIIHAQERAAILSGLVVTAPRGMSILRVGEAVPSDVLEIVQAGPFLLDHTHPVIGLESTRKAYRTFVTTNDEGLWMIGIISPVTLAAASKILYALHSKFLPENSKPLTRALNLDGGSSSSFWADTQPAPFSFRDYVRVRNFLGVRARK